MARNMAKTRKRTRMQLLHDDEPSRDGHNVEDVPRSLAQAVDIDGLIDRLKQRVSSDVTRVSNQEDTEAVYYNAFGGAFLDKRLSDIVADHLEASFGQMVHAAKEVVLTAATDMAILVDAREANRDLAARRQTR